MSEPYDILEPDLLSDSESDTSEQDPEDYPIEDERVEVPESLRLLMEDVNGMIGDFNNFCGGDEDMDLDVSYSCVSGRIGDLDVQDEDVFGENTDTPALADIVSALQSHGSLYTSIFMT